MAKQEEDMKTKPDKSDGIIFIFLMTAFAAYQLFESYTLGFEPYRAAVDGMIYGSLISVVVYGNILSGLFKFYSYQVLAFSVIINAIGMVKASENGSCEIMAFFVSVVIASIFTAHIISDANEGRGSVLN